MTPLRRLRNRERIAVALALGVIAGGLLSLAVWFIVSNHARIGEIQRSRILSAESSCAQQNERHEQLLARIEVAAVVQRVRQPAKYRETVLRARELEAVLNAIQPEENCATRAHQLVVETLHHGRPLRHAPIREPGPLRLPAPEKGGESH